ncbi:MAG TPA: PDZ domain-containing protein [Longimicrobiales bacterium]|nr:PDZ domain-containing protein [Longimicrobiales bacterium]
MRSSLRTLTLVAALALATAPAAAQVVTGTVQSRGQSRGWIGVSFEVLTTEKGGSASTVVTVTDVIRGGPADQAGVRPGDVVITVNGRKWQDQFGSIASEIRPGDPIRMVVEREGRRLELAVTATPRPTDVVVAPQNWSVTFRADSMVDRMYRAMDSLRIRLIREPDGTLAMVGEPGSPDSLAVVLHRIPGGSIRVRSPRRGEIVEVAPFETTHPESSSGIRVPGVRPPFSFFLFRGAEHDSLRAEMEQLNKDIGALQAQQATRTRELSRQAGDVRIDRNDAELRRLESGLDKLELEAVRLRAAMEQATRREVGERFGGTLFEPPAAPSVEEMPAPESGLLRARPLAPYVLGQSRAAGAEVVDLKPELAAYFQVSAGVLVVDVPEGTPAAEAGLQPGDVVIRVGGREVHSILDLREGLARAASDLPITLVRKGKQVQVLLRR